MTSQIPSVQFNELDSKAWGNDLTLVGSIFESEDGVVYLLPFPGDGDWDISDLVQVYLSNRDWEDLLIQSDRMETEILTKAADGLVTKVVLRKSSRQIEQSIVWEVYRRDNFKCRYCAADSVPLTVDHLVTWESGGPSTVDNLVSACKKCNKKRGCLEYSSWLKSEYYQERSKNLEETTRTENLRKQDDLSSISLKVHVNSR